MRRSRRLRMAIVAVTLLLGGVGPAWAARSIVLPRPGQVGVGLQGGFGTLLKSGDFGKTFGSGPTLAVRLRYRMRYERALGLSFENQRLEIRAYEAIQPGSDFGGSPGLPGRTRANVILSGAEFYQMFGTRTRATKMIMVGGGFAQASARTRDNDTVYPGDGTYVSAGLGVERFLWRSWALDLSTRYMAVFIPGGRTDDVQAALGLIFYASY